MSTILTPSPKSVSIKRILLSMVVGLVTCLLILSSYIIASIYISSSEKQLLTSTTEWANVIAGMSVKDIKNKNHRTLENNLKNLKGVSLINYIHIYTISEVTRQVKFFTSYNRSSSYPPLSNKINQINELAQPKITKDIVELTLPIKEGSNILGYIYIQTNSESITATRQSTIALICLVIALSLLFTFLIVFRIENIFSLPIIGLNTTLQEITQTKNYQLRFKLTPVQEVNVMVEHLNTLLVRVSKQIDVLGLAEQESLKLTQELENKVNSRTEALKESNQELLSTLEKLHQFQDQLVENEKMASLGDMVAGVAHEVNTPIGLAVTASTLLSDKLAEIQTSFDEKTLRSSQLKKFLHDSAENAGIIYRNANRAADLISSFKKVAVDQTNEDIRTFNINELLHEVLLSLQPQIKHTPYIINIDCPTELFITSKPGPISQILINLIMNSVIHGFDNRDHGEINISIMTLSSQINIQYQDDGAGINQEFQTKIFDPFTTTKRGSGGSGLGMHLVYNLVTQALSGTINLESAPNKGVLFDINFLIDE